MNKLKKLLKIVMVLVLITVFYYFSPIIFFSKLYTENTYSSEENVTLENEEIESDVNIIKDSYIQDSNVSNCGCNYSENAEELETDVLGNAINSEIEEDLIVEEEEDLEIEEEKTYCQIDEPVYKDYYSIYMEDNVVYVSFSVDSPSKSIVDQAYRVLSRNFCSMKDDNIVWVGL